MMICKLDKDVSVCSRSEEKMECHRWKTGKVVQAGRLDQSFDCEEEVKDQDGSDAHRGDCIILGASERLLTVKINGG